MRSSNKLKDIQCKSAKPREKPYKLTDGEGLFLLVKPSGSKLWRMKYHFQGKEASISFGPYPGTSLVDARDQKQQARKLLRDGINPTQVRKEQELTSSTNQAFEALARDWHTKERNRWTETHALRVLTSLEKDVFPVIGNHHPDEIKPSAILDVIRRIEERGALHVASKTLGHITNIFAYGVIIGWCDNAPTANLHKALEKRTPKNYAHIQANELPQFFAKLNHYQGDPLTCYALKLLIHTFLRPGEIRKGRWSEIDWENKVWRVPAERMKSKREHLIPLTHEVILILREIQKHSGHYELMFPNRSKSYTPMSENTLCGAIKRMGFEATAHGFRITASTELNEQGFSGDAIEAQLAHVPSNKVRATYNKAKYMPERRKIMEYWSKRVSAANLNKEFP